MTFRREFGSPPCLPAAAPLSEERHIMAQRISISEHLETGDLDGAIESLTQDVRQRPTDTNARSLLAELLCVAGNFERADRLLDAVQHQDMSVAVGVALFRQLIRAEEARQLFYTECRLPEFLSPPNDEDQLYLRALVALKDNQPSQAAELLAEAEAKREPLVGHLDNAAFDDMRDLDDLCASHLDVLTSTGKFYWIPLRSIESITLHKPERQRDLVWRRATVSVAGGPDGEVFLPTTYATSGSPPSTLARLGRQTDFVGGDGAPVRGVGLRTFIFGEDAHSILEIGNIEFPAR
jgi:type VI secretion system protein ImpE